MINLLQISIFGKSVKPIIIIIGGICVVPLLMYLNNSGLIDLPLAVTLVVVEVPIGVFLHHITKDKEQNSKSEPNRVITETLADKQKEREDYSSHLRKDIFEIIDSKKLPHYEAICNSDEKKPIILQHFFTYERISNNAIYTRYQEARTIENKVKNAHSKINKLISEIMMETAEITSISGEHIMFEFRPFLNIFDFPETNKFIMLEKDFDIDVINIDKIKFSNLLFHLENIDKKFYVKYDNVIIVETESKKTAKKCLELILKKGTSIIQLVQKLKEEKKTNDTLTKKVVNTIFENMKMLNDSGKPDLGVCDSCIEFFPFPTKDVHRKSLFEFNSILWNKAEEFWE